MSFKDDFNLFFGAEYGKFKGVKACESGTVVKSIQSLNHLNKDSHITALAWSSEDEDEILLGLSDQTVKIYDSEAKVFTLSLDAKFTQENNTSQGSICGLMRYNGIVVTGVESGHIRLLKCDDEEEDQFIIHAGGPISKMRHSMTFPNIIGTGGLENELKLWDLNTGKNTFTAKNVPPDNLQLRVPVWVTDHVFMPASDKVVVGSKYGYVRMYDPKAQKKPVVKVNMPDQAVTCITSSNIENTVLCGLAKGNIASVDLRMGRTSKQYKGFVGAVRDIACHPTEPYVVSVGLDRFLRVHDVNSKDVLVKEYVVSRVNCVLMRSNFSIKSAVSKAIKKSKKQRSKELLSDGTSDHDEAQQFDEMFDSMQKVIDGPSRKKRSIDKPTDNKTSENPSKKRKSLLLVNPFATKQSDPIPKKEKESLKVSDSKECDPDSDDDIMIVSETFAHTTSHEEENEGSEPDEAEGDSDELDEDSDCEGGSGGGGDDDDDDDNDSSFNEDVEGR